MAAPWRIRRAVLADAPRLEPLERRCFSDPWSGTAFTELLRAGYGLGLLAEQDGEVVGYLLGRAVAPEGEILNLAVAPELRRRGLGAALLAAGLTAFGAAGVREVFLEVRESNTSAIELYRRRGFRAVGRRRRYYRRPVEDALVLRLEVPAMQDSGTPALD